MKIIETNNAPKAIWPYSQAIEINWLIYSSWQIAINPETNLFEWWDIESQTKRVCENLWWILKEVWINYKNVIKTTIFLDNLEDFSKVNNIYSKYFSHKPARSTVEVSKLPLWALIEIEIIAKK